MADAQTISADKLCVLTGLTDRRHRQLADDGYFPLPQKSQYQLVPTIQGLFRFYREHALKSRSRLAELQESKADKEDRILGLKLAREERKTVARADVDQLHLHIASLQKTVLYSILENEYPAKVVGRTSAEIKLAGRQVADRLCAIMQREVDQWQPTLD